MSRPAPPYAGGPAGPGWDEVRTAVVTPSPPHADDYWQLNDRAKVSRHTRPAQVRPDMPRTSVEQSTGKPGG
ncbi:MAG TPA: hypothetical protein VFN75_00375 [Pseudonocardiaceae bacterium]|nr:hypothetical protein [Pseudonocardiaceae bacterium]